jgi:YidC/Oxa1 family membrane protein insertase
MDRNTVIGFVLIGLVLFIWMWMNAPPPGQPPLVADSTAAAHHTASPESLKTPQSVPAASLEQTDSLGKYFSAFRTGEQKTVIVETGKYRAEITSRGAALKSLVLKEFTTWDHYPVNLVNTTDDGECNLLFYSSDGKQIDTRHLYFHTAESNWQTRTVPPGDSLKLEFSLDISATSRFIKTYIFYPDRYSFDLSYRFEGMESIVANYEYQMAWESGLRYAERNSVGESNSAQAYAFAGGELTELDASKFGETPKQNLSGRISWVATRNKYFAVAFIPREKESQGAYLEGTRVKMPDDGVKENYNIAIKMPFTGKSSETGRVTVFAGPLDFDIVKQYNVELERVMSLGAAWIIRPISEYVILPVFGFLRYFIPNFGIILIVFSIIIKVALYPLTKSSMKSMQKMQKLQPMMAEIREKYKEDPQKMNQQVMRLYKEYGVNPAGGCLPMLLQLPILYALWAVFSSAIQLRHAAFFWWIQDLSIPDVIVTLPFRLPLFNMSEVSGLALLMGITMFVQQKMSVQDPRQKAMVWMMPVLLTLMFNGFPSGLNLYYFMFNVLSIAQQAWVNKQHKDEPLRKVEEKKNKGGLIGKLSDNLKQARGSK